MTDPKTAAQLLLVDDDPSITDFLAEKFTDEGHLCWKCLSGEAALDLLRQKSFDLVISDMEMPGMSGLQLLRKTRKMSPPPGFVIISGVGEVQAGIEAMKQGAEDYLVKPFQIDAVMISINRALEKKRLERELENWRTYLVQLVDQRTRELQSTLKQVKLAYHQTIAALGSAVDYRDNEVGGHSRRVCRFSQHLARTLRCSKELTEQIAWGAYLHDVGKMGIPDAILRKPGKLTAEEKTIMDTHVHIGYSLVRQIDFLGSAAEIVLTHHERWDGTGYLQGLRGKEIPMGARIFTVADTLDAMTSVRPYRPALPYEAARAEIERESGRQFDPDVVTAFLSTPEHYWEMFRRNIALRLDNFDVVFKQRNQQLD